MDELDFLDEVRIIAQNGLEYADNVHDKERYERLLELVSQQYSVQFGPSSREIKDQFQKEVGHVTPKIGVVGIITNDAGEVLLMKRREGKWSLPGGWLEPAESPQVAVTREIKEETTMDVTIAELGKVVTRKANEGYGPHGALGLVYRCEVEGIPKQTAEATEISYRQPDDVSSWHKNHYELAKISQIEGDTRL